MCSPPASPPHTIAARRHCLACRAEAGPMLAHSDRSFGAEAEFLPQLERVADQSDGKLAIVCERPSERRAQVVDLGFVPREPLGFGDVHVIVVSVGDL